MKERMFFDFWKIGLWGAIILISIVVFACSKEYEDYPDTENTELNGFFQSSSYTEFVHAYGFSKSNLKLQDFTTSSFKENGVKCFTIPVVKGDKQMGKLIVFSKAGGAIYRTIYENMENFREETGGEMSVEINKRPVAKYTCSPLAKNGKTTLRLIEVADVSPASLTKAGAEWPTEDDAWWACTTKCYHYAKEACGGSGPCEMMCDLLDLNGTCTISVGVACGVYCIID